MGLAFAPILLDAGIDSADILVIRHANVQLDENSGLPSLGPHSTDAEILRYTQVQSVNPRSFPASPPRIWIAFMPEGGDRARLWSVLENRGEISNDGKRRRFDLVKSDHLSDLRGRLVIGWRSPRTWRVGGTTAAQYPVLEIADVEPEPFPGFGNVLLDYAKLQAVMSEHRYAAWRTALSSVAGIYLITDVKTGRHYVGKADGSNASPSAGPPTRPTVMAAMPSSDLLILPASASRCSGFSTHRRHQAPSMPPRATLRLPSLLALMA